MFRASKNPDDTPDSLKIINNEIINKLRLALNIAEDELKVLKCNITAKVDDEMITASPAFIEILSSYVELLKSEALELMTEKDKIFFENNELEIINAEIIEKLTSALELTKKEFTETKAAILNVITNNTPVKYKNDIEEISHERQELKSCISELCAQKNAILDSITSSNSQDTFKLN